MPLRCEYWCSVLVDFFHFSISSDGSGGVASFQRTTFLNDAAASPALRFHAGPEALTMNSPSFQLQLETVPSLCSIGIAYKDGISRLSLRC